MEPIAVVFDLFGTLLDINSLQTAAAPYSDSPAALVATWREKQLSYAFAAAIMDRYEDFDTLTAAALRYAAARHGRPGGDGAPTWDALAQSWRSVQPYADALPALNALRARNIRCSVLTNGTPATAAAAIAAAGMAPLIDVTLSVDTVRTYKPDRRVYALATQHYAARPGELLFVTANGWDATGATAFGMPVAWCNRTASPPETFGPAPAWTIANLSELERLVSAPPP